MIGKCRMYKMVLLTLIGVLLGACQPVRPAMELVRTAGVTGDLDFAVSDWGLEHGWFHFNVLAPQQAGAAPTGWVRWVEVNDKQELRYVMAEPRCIVFSEDGKRAVMTVQITSRRGWGDGEAGQFLNLWLHDGGAPGAGNDQFATPFWPPQVEEPGCAYAAQEANVITAVGGDLAMRPGGEALAVAPVSSQRAVNGQFGFPSPRAWGVDLWITQDFAVREVDSATHSAAGKVNWGVYDVLARQWKLIKADARYVFFDDGGQNALVLSQITEKGGEGEGEPGEYAAFWVHDSGKQDQFGMFYYSDFHPDLGFKEFFPADDLPPLEYAAPAEVIAVEIGDVVIGQ
jgi:hypothetical protein